MLHIKVVAIIGIIAFVGTVKVLRLLYVTGFRIYINEESSAEGLRQVSFFLVVATYW